MHAMFKHLNPIAQINKIHKKVFPGEKRLEYDLLLQMKQNLWNQLTDYKPGTPITAQRGSLNLAIWYLAFVRINMYLLKATPQLDQIEIKQAGAQMPATKRQSVALPVQNVLPCRIPETSETFISSQNARMHLR